MNTYSLTNHTNGTLERMETARNAHPAPFTPARAIAAAGDALTRRGLAALAVEHLTSALQRLIELCYELDHDSRLCNVDGVDGRILVPVPWGSVGYRYYALRRRESDVLRLFMQASMTPRKGAAVPLFLYGEDTRAWYLNLSDYPTAADAVNYLSVHGLTIRAYKLYLQRIKETRNKR